MIHLLSVIGVLAAASALAAIAYRLATVVTGQRLRLLRAAVAGLTAAGALVLWVGTVKHAALVKSAAQPMSNGQKLTPGFILADGFMFTFIVVTVVTFAVTAVLGKRRAARWAKQDNGLGIITADDRRTARYTRSRGR